VTKRTRGQQHTEAEWQEFIRQVKRYRKIEAACFKTGIPRSTVTSKMAKWPWFEEAVREAQEFQRGMTRVRLIDEGLPVHEDGTPKPADFFKVQALDKLASPEDYQQTVRHEHAIYFFDVPDTPVLADVTVDAIEAEYTDVDDE
jgi:hypothetical protein